MSAAMFDNMDTKANFTNATPGEMDHYGWFYYYYGYEYDYNAFTNTVPLKEVLPVTLTYGLTLLLGLVGNSLVIFSIAYFRRMRNITNIFLLSLACADLLLVLICIPIKVAAFLSFTWELGGFLCKFVHYMQNVSMICSVATLTLISIERFIVVVFPLRAKSICTMSHAKITVILVWIFSFILAVPIIFGRLHYEVGEFRKGFWCVKKWSEKKFAILYEMYMLFIIFIIPLLVMLCCYIVISISMWRLGVWKSGIWTTGSRKRGVVFQVASKDKQRSDLVTSEGDSAAPLFNSNGRRSDNRDNQDELRKQVVVMLIVVVLLFALCWAPILLLEVLIALHTLDPLHPPIKISRQVFFLLSYLNSCINPIVYAFASKNFRQSFKFAVCACIKGRPFARAYAFAHSRMSTRTSTVNTGLSAHSVREKENGSGGSDSNRFVTSTHVDDLELGKI